MLIRHATAVWIVALAAQAQADAEPPFVLSRADTMEKVFRDEPWDRPAVDELVLCAAKNEVEGIQLVVAPRHDLREVTVDVTQLAGEAGLTIPVSAVRWHVVGYVETEQPPYPTPKVGWWPDPLLPPRAFDVRAGQVQPIWINVHVPADAAAGTYRGRVTVRAGGHRQSVALEVRVWDFAVPVRQNLESCFLLRPDNLRQFYRLPKVPLEMYERWIDFCVDHRLSLTLCDWPDFSADMERLAARQLQRGGSVFCLSNAWFHQGDPETRRKHNAEMVARIQGLYDRAKQRGWIDRAYIYCHDEIDQQRYPFAKELYGELKKAMPDLRLMQTFYKDDPVPALDDVLDVWAPNTGRYRQAEFQAQQAKGDDVWWYVCCGPGKPYANLMIEWPAIDHRLLVWQNWKFRVTGLLYWGTAVWRDNLEGERRWPEVPWKPATWRNAAGQPHHGDGQLIYPGPDGNPLSSIRLENLRDGIEDYEYFWLLREAVGRLNGSGAGQHQTLIAEAERVLAVDEEVVKDLTHFTDQVEVVRAARARIARLIQRARAAGAPGGGPNTSGAADE